MRAFFLLVLVLCVIVAGCGRQRATDSAPGAPSDTASSRAIPPDTSRSGPAFLAVYRDGPLDEIRVVRATDGALVVAGEVEFPAGTWVTVSLLHRTAGGTLETVATNRAQVDLGHFMSGPLSTIHGPPPPGVHVIRVSVPFGPPDQEPAVLQSAAEGRRYRGSGMRTRPDGTVEFATTLEVPL